MILALDRWARVRLGLMLKRNLIVPGCPVEVLLRVLRKLDSMEHRIFGGNINGIFRADIQGLESEDFDQ